MHKKDEKKVHSWYNLEAGEQNMEIRIKYVFTSFVVLSKLFYNSLKSIICISLSLNLYMNYIIPYLEHSIGNHISFISF